jgi:hypothetical protein
VWQGSFQVGVVGEVLGLVLDRKSGFENSDISISKTT